MSGLGEQEHHGYANGGGDLRHHGPVDAHALPSSTGRAVPLRAGSWSMVLDSGSASDVGGRPRNEDSHVAASPVFAVADGVGGHRLGALASSTAIGALAALEGCADLSTDDVVSAVAQAASAVRALGGPDGTPGTTLTLAVLTVADGRPYWVLGNVGDSRTYLRTGAGLRRVSVDHSLVQELVDAGHLDEVAARNHADRHVLTRALGSDDRADFWLVPIGRRDRLLLCSDGVSAVLPDSVLDDVLTQNATAAAAATALVTAALAAGTRDNATAVVVDVLAFDGPTEPDGAPEGDGLTDSSPSERAGTSAWEPVEITEPRYVRDVRAGNR